MNNADSASPGSVEDSLRRILQSRKFVSSPNLSKFLRYVVEQKLAGNEADLKAYSIAVDALGQPESFDAQIDPRVRVLGGRIRTALTEYYSDEGAEDPVRISMPTGGYKPVFSRSGVAEPQEPGPEPGLAALIKGRSPKQWLVVATVLCMAAYGFGHLALLGLRSTTPSSQRPEIAPSSISILVRENPRDSEAGRERQNSGRFIQDLRAALARNEALSIVLPSNPTGDDLATMAEPSGPDFVINTTIHTIAESRRISVELTNGRTNVLVWARTKTIDLEFNPLKSSEEVVGQFVRELSSQVFGASIRALEGRDPDTLSASQLFVLATWVPGPARNSLKWEKQRIELARLALKKAPEFGPAYSVLADKLAYLAAVDGPSDGDQALSESKNSAARAVELAPGDANTLFNVAQSQWHSGQLNASIRTLRRVLELDPNHSFARFFSTVYPFTCFAAPDEVLDFAVSFDKSLGTDNPIRWVTLTWKGWLHVNREEFDLALDAEQRAAQIFQVPYTVMRHAAILNRLGRTDEAADIILAQRSNWPNLDPAHFSTVTMPRLCQEYSGSEKMLGFYADLTRAIAPRLTR